MTFSDPSCTDAVLRRALIRVIHAGDTMGSLAEDKTFVDEVLRGSNISILDRIENMYATLLKVFRQRFSQVRLVSIHTTRIHGTAVC